MLVGEVINSKILAIAAGDPGAIKRLEMLCLRMRPNGRTTANVQDSILNNGLLFG